MLALLRQVAADVITPRFRMLADHEVMEKNPGDLVTVADREAEVIITAALQREYPDALVVGEEATAADPALLDRLVGASRAWTVDPIDGTKNFVHGRADHAVMVAELRDGVTVRGWIWQPEHGAAYVAERGAGLFRNGVRVGRDAVPSSPAQARVATSRPSEQGRHDDLTFGPTAWCCGVDYPWLATGEVDALVYAATKPWDHAPGSLFVAEVGGVTRHVDGTEYRPGLRNDSRLVAAADDDLWQAVAHAVRPPSPQGER